MDRDKHWDSIKLANLLYPVKLRCFFRHIYHFFLAYIKIISYICRQFKYIEL